MLSNSNISFCTFNSLSVSYGGAIYIDNLIFDISLFSCIFEKCSTSQGKNSNARTDGAASGGCCYLDINSLNLFKTYSTLSKSSKFCHSIYVSIPRTQNCYIDCISDSLSGCESSPLSSIFGLDLGNFYTYNINISYPKQIRTPGTIHYGMFTTKIVAKYNFVIFNEESTNSMAISFSLQTDSESDIEFRHILNRKTTDSVAILGFYRGIHKIKNYNFIDCSGIFDDIDSLVQKISFSNCYSNEQLTKIHNSVVFINDFVEIKQITKCKILSNCISCSFYDKKEINIKIAPYLFIFIDNSLSMKVINRHSLLTK